MSDSKVIMFPETGTSGSGSSGIDSNLLALLNQNGGFGGNGNWMWIFFLWFLWPLMRGNNGMFGSSSDGVGALSNQIANSDGRELLMQAINGNGTAIERLSNMLNTSISNVQTAINGVSSQVANVGNQVGMSGLQVINAIQAGNATLANQLATCCCENRLAICQQTNTLTSRIDQLANGVQTGFASIGYETSQQTNALQNMSNSNTQRIVDLLNAHWNQELQQKYQDARLELSQQSQNAYLISQLKTTTTTTA